MSLNVIYLHGFASSPESSKAIRIAEALRPLDVSTHIPDLNAPSFRDITVTRMIEQVRAVAQDFSPADAARVVLIGSSLGAFVAVNAAAGDARVKGLVLLAPALDFGADESGKIGDVTIADWKAAGVCEVFHYARGQAEHLDYTLYDDARRYDAFRVPLDVPVLVFQGTRDTVVDPQVVRRWCEGRANVTLVELDDDHQLQGSIDRICDEASAFVARLR